MDICEKDQSEQREQALQALSEYFQATLAIFLRIESQSIDASSVTSYAGEQRSSIP